MKCIHCGEAYSDGVLPIHQEWCGTKDEEENVVDSIDDMTAAKLKAYAKENNIDLGEAKTKEEILVKIKGV